MRRIHTVFAALAPLLLAGGLLGGLAATTRADDGSDVTQDVSDDDDDADRNDAARDAARDAQHAARDAQRAARDAQRDAQQTARQAVREARTQARDEIRAARDQVLHDKSIPPAIREMVLKRLEAAAAIVDKHLDKASNTDDLGAMTAELSAMGAELGQTMGGMNGDMQKLQKDMMKMGQQMAKQYGKGFRFRFDTDGSNDDADSDDNFAVPPPPVPPVPPVPPMPPMPPPGPGGMNMHGSMDVDLSDLDIDVNLDDLQLSPSQRDQLVHILDGEQQASERAETQINALSEGLRGMLQDPNARENDVGNMVDQISAAEGAYRKERILAWVRTRKVLTEQQRDTLLKATSHHRHHGH